MLWAPVRLRHHRSVAAPIHLIPSFLQWCLEAYAQKCQGKQLPLGWCLNNLRKQKVGKEVKGKGSFVYSSKKYLLSTSYVPGPGLLSLCWTGKEAESEGIRSTVEKERVNIREISVSLKNEGSCQLGKRISYKNGFIKTLRILWQRHLW